MIIGLCAQTTTESYLLVGFLILGMILLLMGFRMAIFGLLAGILLLVLSWFIVGCIALIGYIIASLGIVSVIYFAVRRNPV